MNLKKSLRLQFVLTLALLSTSALQARFIEHKEHSLGPTGLLGVTSPKDIKVTKVIENSPAAGKIQVGDIITAAGKITFANSTRQQLAAAIDQAQSKQGGGQLTLTLKDGKKVALKLGVLGSYSDTAPYNCPKTDALITQTADAIVQSKKFGRGDMNIGLLGLLATGEKKYIEVVKQAIHAAKWAQPDIQLSLDKYVRTAWGWGYTNLLLCEYYLLTGDKFVLPAIKAYSVALAKGRDAGGLWGHGVATLDINNGQLHGRLPGYAQMNQSSLPCFISLLLAEKCGINHPEIQAAIKQNHVFYQGFIGKGTLPYGVHDPKPKSYNNNGMSGLTAVAMALIGDKKGAIFFTQMSAASHNIMETGHTGHYFNQLWTGLGANLAGPATSAAFFKKTKWLHTLNRTWDGNYTYDGCGYPNGIFSYRGLSDAGSHLLNLSLGRAKLHITGRDADSSIFLKGKEVEEIIALPTLDFKSMSDEELLASFGHPMPKVRLEAVWSLRDRDHKLMPSIVKMLKQGTEFERNSAIGYFGYGCPKEKVLPVKNQLASIMRDPQEDIEIRAVAARALCWLGEDAHPYFNDMLKIIVADKPQDPLGHSNGFLGNTINSTFPNAFKAGLITDKKLFYAAVLKLLDHRRAVGRIAGTGLILNMPIEDFHRVADKVIYIIEDKDRTYYHAYHNLGPKTNGITLLANLNIEGGIEYALETLESKAGKFGFKIRMLMAVLPKYGANAQAVLPKLKEMDIKGRFEKPWNNMIKSIESAEKNGELMTVQDAIHLGKIKH
jgi:hypothetical protein